MVATLNFYLDPELSYSWIESSILAAKAFTQENFPSIVTEPITHLSSRMRSAQDIVDYVATAEVQQWLGTRARGIHVRTARRWLHKLSWRYRQKKKGMYIDGHEREDVVEYRKGFVERGFPVPQGVRFRLILVTHDESTFYENDRRKTHWINDNAKPVAEKKGEGQSIMASEFITCEWGRVSKQ